MGLQIDEITNLIYKFADNGSLFSDIITSLDKIDINNPKNLGAITALEHASVLSKKLNEAQGWMKKMESIAIKLAIDLPAR